MTEENLRQTIAALDMRRAQLENITRQREIVRASIDEHHRAKETLDQYAKAPKKDEMRVPIGAGVFISVKPANQVSAISSIGSGILKEVKFSDLSKDLDMKIEEMQKGLKELGEQAEKISNSVEELTNEAQSQYDALQSGAAQPLLK